MSEIFISAIKSTNNSTERLVYFEILFGLIGVLANYVAGKMLNKNVARTTLFFLFGTILIPILLQYSVANTFATIVVIGLWGFLYSPSFLNASTYMISSASEAMEFANSLATSFGNLGVTVGTTVSGIVIVKYGINYIPWLTLGFGSLSVLMIFIRYNLEKKAAVELCV